MAGLNNPTKEPDPEQNRQATRKRGLTLASAGVLVIDVFGLLALAILAPLLRWNCEGTLSSSLVPREAPAVTEFLLSINGVDYALFFVVLALILIAKEIPIRDKKAALGVNIAVAVGGIVFAVVFTIAMHVPIVMMLWDMRRL